MPVQAALSTAVARREANMPGFGVEPRLDALGEPSGDYIQGQRHRVEPEYAVISVRRHAHQLEQLAHNGFVPWALLGSNQ